MYYQIIGGDGQDWGNYDSRQRAFDWLRAMRLRYPKDQFFLVFRHGWTAEVSVIA